MRARKERPFKSSGQKVCHGDASVCGFRPAGGTVTDTICVASKPGTSAVADDLSGALFDRGAFPGTLVTVEQRTIG